jgi:hypothetical protein
VGGACGHVLLYHTSDSFTRRSHWHVNWRRTRNGGSAYRGSEKDSARTRVPGRQRLHKFNTTSSTCVVRLRHHVADGVNPLFPTLHAPNDAWKRRRHPTLGHWHWHWHWHWYWHPSRADRCGGEQQARHSAEPQGYRSSTPTARLVYDACALSRRRQQWQRAAAASGRPDTVLCMSVGSRDDDSDDG